MTRPKRFESGPFKDFTFKESVMFEVKNAAAYDLYAIAAGNEYLPHDQIDWAFNTGELVYVDITGNAVDLKGM